MRRAFPSFGRKNRLNVPAGSDRSKSASPSRANSTRSDSLSLSDIGSSRTTAEVLVNAAFNGLHIAADFGGVPGLFTAVTIVETIAELCMNVRRNRCAHISSSKAIHSDLTDWVGTKLSNSLTSARTFARRLRKRVKEEGNLRS